MMKLSVRKEEGVIPGSGFHYMLHPKEMRDDFEVICFKQMGHVVIEVNDVVGHRLLEEANAALKHQLEIAHLTESELNKRPPPVSRNS